MTKLSVVTKMTDPVYISESSEFLTWVDQQVTGAKRMRDDLANEVVGLEAQIQARMLRITDLDTIILKGEAALSLTVPITRKPPTLADRS